MDISAARRLSNTILNNNLKYLIKTLTNKIFVRFLSHVQLSSINKLLKRRKIADLILLLSVQLLIMSLEIRLFLKSFCKKSQFNKKNLLNKKVLKNRMKKIKCSKEIKYLIRLTFYANQY